jgi:hypothetical protein
LRRSKTKTECDPDCRACAKQDPTQSPRFVIRRNQGPHGHFGHDDLFDSEDVKAVVKTTVLESIVIQRMVMSARRPVHNAGRSKSWTGERGHVMAQVAPAIASSSAFVIPAFSTA